jgi:uncharacterized protein YyaL (SSP411 family)
LKGKTPNRLVNEKSPYLRQHAHNPVDWYPWGEEAFAAARKENKPIFLSIGYSACHWCHVMERESFADPEVARLLNAAFVSIKVDREERPDIDAFYMEACQLLTGQGGWPLTIFMTPDKNPFFAGTYFPRESRFGLVGLKDLIPRAGKAWAENKAALMGTAERIRAALKRPELSKAGKAPSDLLERTRAELEGRYDAANGGFGGAPKFPTPHHLTFLLRCARRSPDPRPREMVENTLRAMHCGGVYDHLGFGFHRYSTDAAWRVPHFEKMIYDQALLAMAYIEAYQLTARMEFRRTIEEIMTYISRDMTSEEGGFFTAEDADSAGKEGKFYLWTEEEIREALSSDEAALAVRVFNVRGRGNLETAGPDLAGKNVLFLSRTPAGLAAELSLSEEVLRARVRAIRQKLFLARGKRPRPFKDEKVLADWNGLMIAALAKASRALDREDYAVSGKKAADFIRRKMTRRGEIYHRYAEGELKVPGFLDDYAFLIWGLTELYAATFAGAFLQRALELTDTALDRFWDEGGAGFFSSPAGARDLPARRKGIYDAAVPSGNSVMTANLLRLSRLTGRADLKEKAENTIEALAPTVAQAPLAHTAFMSALDFAHGPSFEIVIVGRTEAADTSALLESLGRNFLPNTVVLFRPAEKDSPEILKLAPYVAPMTAIGRKATAYVCSGFRCLPPVTDPDKMMALLDQT